MIVTKPKCTPVINYYINRIFLSSRAKYLNGFDFNFIGKQ